MKRLLILDRDGIVLSEPPEDYQVDSLEKLEYIPGVFKYLGKIAETLDYELIMITNQDGLGSKSFPEETFWPAHNKMLKALKNEGINFSAVYIDKTFPEENAPTRKPGTALLQSYMDNPEYDLSKSYVVGDRLSDMQLAANLGAKGIWKRSDLFEYDPKKIAALQGSIALDTREWKDIWEYLRFSNRCTTVSRVTKETSIEIELDLDGSGVSEIDTGIAFFDHMLDQLSRHGGLDLKIEVQGDLEIDEHHTIEDTALALGEAFRKVLSDKRGMQRYGFCLPMDDCLALAAVDFGGRPWCVWEADFKREMIGKMPTEMFFHFFKSFSDAARCNLNIRALGDNEHHKIESIFKAWARAIRQAIRRDPDDFQLPSTKGLL